MPEPRSREPVVTGSDHFNLFVLRRLYNKGNRGKGVAGEIRRIELHTSITPETTLALSRIVPAGRGKYSAPVVEMSLRLMASCFGQVGQQTVAEELCQSIKDRARFVKHLKMMAFYIETYVPVVGSAVETEES